MSEIFKRIPLIIEEIGAVEKTRKNTQGSGYMFRGIDDIVIAVKPLLAKHKVFIATNVLSSSREERQSKSGSNLIYTILNVEHSFYAEDGSFVKVITIGESMDSGDKSCNKAMSAALKYAFTQTFCIPTDENKDTENETHETTAKFATREQLMYLMSLAKQKNITPEEVKNAFAKIGVTDSTKTPIREYNEILKELTNLK